MQKFTLVFLAIVLYILLWFGIVAIPIAITGGDEEAALVIVLATLVLFPITLIPFMQFIAKRIFHFKGQAGPGQGSPGQDNPISEDALRSLILNINHLDAPVMVKEGKNGRLIATWNYLDARWWQLLAKAGLQKVYELHLKLDGDSKTVTMIDIHKSVSWRAGPGQVKVSGGFFRGVSTTYEIGKQWGIKENFELGQIYDYKFISDEIKYPIMNTILRHGWDVRFALW